MQPSLAEVFLARCEARAILVGAGYLELPDAVDGLQAAAVAYGLVDKLGQDAVQAWIAAAFADLAADADNVSIRPERARAPGATVEALMFSLRERDIAALSDRACRRRLADLSTDQVRGVIARLIALRSRYPITDELLFKLGEQL
jgi:hypothetical protein